MKPVSQIGTGVFLLALGMSAFAGPRAMDHGISVDHADLNLNSQQGVEKLYTRIRSAVDNICGVTNSREPLGIRKARATCVNDTLDRTVHKIDNDMLDRLHSS